FALVFHRRIVNRHLLALRPMFREAALGDMTIDLAYMVLDTNVSKSATHHDLMIAPPRAILVEIGPRNLPLEEILPGRSSLLDRARRGNMIGRDLVAEERQNPRIDDVIDRLRLHSYPLEIRRIAHIGRADIPFIGLAWRRLYLAPMHIALENI